MGAMDKLQGRFDVAGKQVKSQEAEFDRDLDGIIAGIKMREDRSLPTPVAKALEEVNASVDAAVDAWRKRVDSYERNTEFRRDHEDSLLVYVYGLVKSGKSSLGNFIAHGCHDPDEAFVASLPADRTAPEFFVRAVASEEDGRKASEKLAKARRFYTDVEEATDRIQGFKLPGLTWIDSPGRGSLTEANEKLASEYVESADLVLVTMNSAQPGREGEIAETRYLMRVGKPMMILLTRADEVDVDVDENGRTVEKLVMKSAVDRQDMSEWVESRLREAVGNKGGDAVPQVTSVSVRYAEEHPDGEGVRESGVAAMFDLLREIAESKGVAIKRETPARRFRAFVRDVVGEEQNVGIDDIVGRVSILRKALAKSCEQHKERGQRAGEDAAYEVEKMIGEEVDARREDLDNARLHEEVRKRFRQIVEKQVCKEAGEMAENIDVAMRSLMGDEVPPELQRTFRKVPVKERSRKGSLIGALVGTAVGFLIGGPGVAVAGAGVGATVGQVVFGLRTRDDTVTVPAGDNAPEVKNKLATAYGREARKAATEAFVRLNNEVLQPLEQRVAGVITILELFRDKWERETAQ